MPSKYLRLGDTAVSYVHTGTTTLPDVPPPLDRGATLLFVHGEGGSAGLWAAQMAHFGAAHSPVAIDLPAHGRSTDLDPPATVDAATELLASVLVGLSAPPAVVIGHGLGGHLAVALAAHHPERVRAVVAIGTAACSACSPEEIDKLERCVQGRIGQPFDTPYFGPSPDMNAMRSFWMEMVKTDPRTRLADMLAYRASDLRPALAKVKVPTLILQGDADRLCARASAEELAAGIGGARLEIVEGAGHVAHVEKPAEVNAAIDRWLDASGAGRGR